MYNLVAIGPVVSEEKLFEIVDRWTDRRTTKPAYTISCPGAFGSGELKSKISRNDQHFSGSDKLNMLFFLLKMLKCQQLLAF